MTPQADGAIRFNALGGSGWKDGGQKAVWKFHVEEDGLYKIAMRTLQNYEPNHAIFRTIYVDGEVPFSEMLHYRFPYQSGWQSTVLQNDEEEPYYFYLTKGEHTLAMEATYA